MTFSHWRGFNSASDMRALRRSAGLTQAQLGALSGYSRQAVYYYEGQSGSISGRAATSFCEVIEAKGLHVPGFGEPPVVPVRPITKRTRCGAKTRSGGECQCRPLASGRCKFHGGMSTGPKTEEGRRRISEALKARHRRKRLVREIEAKVAAMRTGVSAQ